MKKKQMTTRLEQFWSREFPKNFASAKQKFELRQKVMSSALSLASMENCEDPYRQRQAEALASIEFAVSKREIITRPENWACDDFNGKDAGISVSKHGDEPRGRSSTISDRSSHFEFDDLEHGDDEKGIGVESVGASTSTEKLAVCSDALPKVATALL